MRSSSARIWWLRALTVRFSWVAARVRFRARAIATKACNACNGGRLIGGASVLNGIQLWVAKVSLFYPPLQAYLVVPSKRRGYEHDLFLEEPAAAGTRPVVQRWLSEPRCRAHPGRVGDQDRRQTSLLERHGASTAASANRGLPVNPGTDSEDLEEH